MEDNAVPLLILLFIIVGFFLFFLPSIIARNKRDALSIFLLNFFLGATGVGWIIALVWACKKDAEPTIIYIEKNEQPGLNPALSNLKANNKSLKLDEPFNPVKALLKIIITIAIIIAMITLISYLSDQL